MCLWATGRLSRGRLPRLARILLLAAGLGRAYPRGREGARRWHGVSPRAHKIDHGSEGSEGSGGSGGSNDNDGSNDDDDDDDGGNGDDDDGGGCRRVSRPPRDIAATAELTNGQATTRQRAIKNARVSGEERRTERKKENGMGGEAREGDARICAFIRADTLGGQ